MPEDKIFTFDQQSMRRISAAVQKSEGVKDRKGNGWYPVKGGVATLQIGKTNSLGEWTINTEATLDVWIRNPETGLMEKGTGTFKAFNIFATVGPGKFVGCLNGFLISAEC